MPLSIARLGDRSLFPDLEAQAYLAHASISPLSASVQEGMVQAAAQYGRQGAGAFGDWDADRDGLRADLAAIIGTQAAHIGLVPNTTFGLAMVALSLPWRAGDTVVVFKGEYPTNVTVWQRAAELFDLRLVELSVSDLAGAGGADFAPLEAALARGVRLVAISAAQFQTGLRTPLEPLAKLCAAHGAELAVDAVQAAGAVPIDVSVGIHYLAAGGHKFLMGPEGGGFLYVEPTCMAALRPAVAGSMSYQGAMEVLNQGKGYLRYDRPLRTDVRVFEGGMLSTVCYAGLARSVAAIAGLGVAAIHGHVNRYLDQLETGLVAQGFTSHRCADEERRSCILGMDPPADIEAPTLCTRLLEHGVVCSGPDGVLRAAPQWPNRLSEVPMVLDAVAESCRSLRG